jgi:alpha-L-fucosidase
MKHIKISSVFFAAVTFFYLICSESFCQNSSGNNISINPGDTPEQIITKAANVTPSQIQYEWQKLEFTAFIHFGINTFDEVEWGQKNVDISQFNPKDIDVKQWVKVLKDAGVKLVILTTKHHDGFCLWPTKYKKLNISNTPFQNGKGDIVRDLSSACREAGLKFGVYLSPWDMHEDFYGSPEYNTFFLNQLTELLTNYGEISEVWFDGANGEGPNGKKQNYDWQSYYKLIRKLQPKAVIAVMGPDVRWVGTESGYGRQTEWSVLPGASANQDKIASNSQQQSGDGAFIPHDLVDEDLGSRMKIEKASSLVWYPAEIDVSIRPKWFYNSNDDDLVKSPYKLVDIYYNSVGLNGVLLLNVPPDKRGLICDNDIKSLQGMRYLLDETFKTNLVANCAASASSEKKGNEVSNILDGNLDTYWTTDGAINQASIEIDLGKSQSFNRAVLQENILVGQRIEKFHLEYWNGSQWNKFAEATTVGYKRMLRFPETTANKIKIVIDECRNAPTLASFGLYKAPPEITFVPNGGTFADSVSFGLISDTKGAKIYYTLDGSVPDENSLIYKNDVILHNASVITAIVISEDGVKSVPVAAGFNKAKYGIEYKSTYDEKYPGTGIYTLVNGVTGNTNFTDGRWQGYNGSDLDVIINLGKVEKVNSISTRFLRDVGAYIFLPASIEFSISNDKKDFTTLGKIIDTVDQNNKKPIVQTFKFEQPNISGRFVRVKANNIGICPKWHKGAGDKAWMFTDEIIIE